MDVDRLAMFPQVHYIDTTEYGVYTVCPGSSDPFYTVAYYIKWVTTSRTHSIIYYKFSTVQ